MRNQLVLNLARNDVKEYIFAVLDKLASEYNIRYFKWDMNRLSQNPAGPRPAHPIKESCGSIMFAISTTSSIDCAPNIPSSRSNPALEAADRIDLGILQRTDEVWTSDNTEAFDRLRIQEGFSQIFAPKVMSAWVTDVPNMNGRSTPLQYRFLRCMQGALGIGANLNKWTDQDAEFAAKMIALYKRIRPTIQTGNLYRLSSPRTSDITANEYVSSGR